MLDLGKSMVVKGDLSASEDLTIEGRVEGTITVGGHTLTVGHHGQIEAQSSPGLRQSAARFTAT